PPVRLSLFRGLPTPQLFPYSTLFRSLGFFLLVFVLVSYLRGTIEVAGFTTLASMLALLSGAMMLSIGIVGEYLGRLHFRSMQRPDRKSTRLNSSHVKISYAVFSLKKK